MHSFHHGGIAMRLALLALTLDPHREGPLFAKPIIGEKRPPVPRSDLDRIALDRAEAKRARKAARKL